MGSLFLVLAAWAGFGPRAAPCQETGSRPNILIIVADDLGIDQVGAYRFGPDPPPTPNIDALATGGVLFRNVWANPICSPSRACLQTGRYSFRTGIGGRVAASSFSLPSEEITLPEMLDLGTGGAYAHAAFGKWHLGPTGVGGNHAPNQAGYSHFAGALGNLGDLGGYTLWTKVTDGASSTSHGYATTENVDDALTWIQSVPEPWLCYLAFNAPHRPWHIPPPQLHGFDFQQEDTDRLRYKAMVEAMDTEIGRLLADLGDARGRTQVFFLADNGTAAPILPPETPSRQSKWHLFQGGVQVPLIVNGPLVGAPGSECRALVNITDIFSTVAELAGVDLVSVYPPDRPLDSISMMPYFSEPSRASSRKAIFSEIFEPSGFGPYDYYASAIMDGEYKVILSHHYTRHEPEALYHLKSDLFEGRNLLTQVFWSVEAERRYRRLLHWMDRIRQ